MEEKDQKENTNKNTDKKLDTNNIEFLLEEIKKKDEQTENLQKENKELIIKNQEEITLLKKEINNLKNKHEKEINSLRQYK